jgi:hypothetical protein
MRTHCVLGDSVLADLALVNPSPNALAIPGIEPFFFERYGNESVRKVTDVTKVMYVVSA